MKSKAHFMERVSREMDQDLPFLDGSTAELLAACCRILGKENHESGLAGQVTARADQPGSWWTLQFGYGFEEASAERMVLVSCDPAAAGRDVGLLKSRGYRPIESVVVDLFPHTHHTEVVTRFDRVAP